MKVKHDIVYAPKHGERGRLDLVLPDDARDRPIVVVIHGGGLREFSKERAAGWAAFIVEQGWVAVNTNYRLLGQSPYPACLEDVLDAVRWVQNAERDDLAVQDRSRIAILGGSAGGFLAMMAGVIVGADAVRAIVSISGPTLSRYCWGGDEAARSGSDPRLYASPVELANPAAPDLLATHSRNDTLVKPGESMEAVEAWLRAGCRAELYLYDGPGDLHGIWRDDTLPLRLFGHIEREIAAFLREAM